MDPISRFVKLKDEVLFTGRVGLLCNQVSFQITSGLYLFQILKERGSLKRIFIPEHGLFGELQDQVPLSNTGIYSEITGDVSCVSLYGRTEDTLTVEPEFLRDLDALVVDIQDVGSRYYTFATTFSYILDVLSDHSIGITVYVIDRINPSGRQIEGTLLDGSRTSFVGREGLPHRHGLTIGELANFYKNQNGGNFDLKVIKLSPEEISVMNGIHNGKQTSHTIMESWFIPPSPNMPTKFTPLLYSGQCLLEGTNLSEGRGTTRPFEIFGAPFLKNCFSIADKLSCEGARLRPLKYIPAFHKHSGSICNGFQIHVTGEKYHSLLHTMDILRYFRDSESDFKFLKGVYEYRSDLPAIELLAGDEDIVSYLYGNSSRKYIIEKLESEEKKWILIARDFNLYSDGDFFQV